jgi:hypothetical protein
MYEADAPRTFCTHSRPISYNPHKNSLDLCHVGDISPSTHQTLPGCLLSVLVH